MLAESMWALYPDWFARIYQTRLSREDWYKNYIAARHIARIAAQKEIDKALYYFVNE